MQLTMTVMPSHGPRTAPLPDGVKIMPTGGQIATDCAFFGDGEVHNNVVCPSRQVTGSHSMVDDINDLSSDVFIMKADRLVHRVLLSETVLSAYASIDILVAECRLKVRMALLSEQYPSHHKEYFL
jgi:hypothetical protein